VRVSIELITPIAMDEGLRFAIREGGRTVGAGVVGKNPQVNGHTTPPPARTTQGRHSAVTTYSL